MEISSDKEARKILAVGVIFASVGILALLITWMQPHVVDERTRDPDEIFTRPSVEERAELLTQLETAASTTPAVTESEKLELLAELERLTLEQPPL